MKSCCCCFSLRSGGTIIAFLELVGAIIGIISCIIFLCGPNEADYRNTQANMAALNYILNYNAKQEPSPPPVDWATKVANRKNTTPIPIPTNSAKIDQNQNLGDFYLAIRVSRIILGLFLILNATQMVAAVVLSRGINNNIPSYLQLWINYRVIMLVLSILLSIVGLIVVKTFVVSSVQIILSIAVTAYIIKVILDLKSEINSELKNAGENIEV